MMKKWIAVLLACLMLLAAAALAEDVESAIRGKTLIIRMPDAWIQEKIQDAAPHVGWWGDDGQSWSWKSPASEWMLSLFIMNGSAPAEGSAILPAYMYGGEMEMSLNRIGESWYAVLRLEEASDSKDIQYELCNVDYGISDMGVLTAKEESCVTVEMALNPQDMSAMQPDFTARYDNIKISLFPALGATAAVIVEENADKDLLREVQMLVDYSCGPLLNGYMDGEDAVYCCMVSNETAQDIRNGAQVKFLRPSFARDADFENTAYAAVQKGTGDWGIINTSGEWVVEPQYKRSSRPDPERNHWDTPRYFLCRSGKDGLSLTVRHGETMRVIAELPGESENGGNPAVFI
ncbi:MAG: WG repeat-containing protein [Clostridia bacterium]|nr:WG repeat-containing protein [Clostridia bacterium]